MTEKQTLLSTKTIVMLGIVAFFLVLIMAYREAHAAVPASCTSFVNSEIQGGRAPWCPYPVYPTSGPPTSISNIGWLPGQPADEPTLQCQVSWNSGGPDGSYSIVQWVMKPYLSYGCSYYAGEQLYLWNVYPSGQTYIAPLTP